MSEQRITCREELRRRGLPYPRSSCAECGSLIRLGWRCPHDPISGDLPIKRFAEIIADLDERFRAHPWWKKRIEGTPLENDLAVISAQYTIEYFLKYKESR